MLPTIRRIYRNPLDEIHRELDRIVHSVLPGESDLTTAAYPVDIREDEDSIIVEAELPGFKKEDINVTLEQGVLSISAERKTEETKGETHLNERCYRRIARSFKLPVPVDENKVEAKLSDGILTLKLAKREEVKPRKIEVK
ncbi:MAG: Hsp20/alpha crystallin family protein [Phycisphaeraceae bacterium]